LIKCDKCAKIAPMNQIVEDESDGKDYCQDCALELGLILVKWLEMK